MYNINWNDVNLKYAVCSKNNTIFIQFSCHKYNTISRRNHKRSSFTYMYVDPALATQCFSTGRSALRLLSEQGELLCKYPSDELVVGVCALSAVAISLREAHIVCVDFGNYNTIFWKQGRKGVFDFQFVS